MGTRGLWGFRYNGQDKLTYNHFDSYPSNLGKTLIDFVKKSSVEEMKNIFNYIKLVNEKIVPTENEVKECIRFKTVDLGVGNQNYKDWYCLLRNSQGNPNYYRDGLKYMIDSSKFIKDSLFCEYTYIINLDNECLEFYNGFQKTYDENPNNRYSKKDSDNDEYFPCKLLGEIPFMDLNLKTLEALEEKEQKE